MRNRNLKFETLQLHVGQESADPTTGSRAVPIYQTTSYVFDNSAHAAARFNLEDAGNIYGRLTNSTQDVLEKRVAALEGGVAALALSSGAAAITYAILALAQNGDHIVAQKTIYGGSYNLLAHTLKQYGITTTFVDIHNLEEVENAIYENTKAIYIETLGNPNADIPDISVLSKIAHKNNIPLVIDNTFGTPYLIRPIEYGADIVVHSATKFYTGATLSPFNAFLLLQGIETLSLRLERHVQNTQKVVEFLKNHPQVENVNHPSLENHPNHNLYNEYFPNGGGSIFTFYWNRVSNQIPSDCLSVQSILMIYFGICKMALMR